MTFKLDLSYKGKTFHLDSEVDSLVGKKIGDTIDGEEINKDLEGAEFVITGASDKAGFPHYSEEDGTVLKRVLLTKGFGLKHKHKKKKTSSPTLVKGIRMRRTLRGNTIGEDTIQINLKMIKEGPKSLAAMLGKTEKTESSSLPETQQVSSNQEEEPTEEKKEEPTEEKKEEPTEEKKEE